MRLGGCRAGLRATRTVWQNGGLQGMRLVIRSMPLLEVPSRTCCLGAADAHMHRHRGCMRPGAGQGALALCRRGHAPAYTRPVTCREP